MRTFQIVGNTHKQKSSRPGIRGCKKFRCTKYQDSVGAISALNQIILSSITFILQLVTAPPKNKSQISTVQYQENFKLYVNITETGWLNQSSYVRTTKLFVNRLLTNFLVTEQFQYLRFFIEKAFILISSSLSDVKNISIFSL